jgi:hypothetical protein
LQGQTADYANVMVAVLGSNNVCKVLQTEGLGYSMFIDTPKNTPVFHRIVQDVAGISETFD